MAEAQHQIHPFEPVFDDRSRILILGSFPSVRSREEGFYYGHPRNRFWQLLSACFGESVPMSIDEKRQMLLGHSISLWDVLASCRISGSADSSITAAVPNELQRILDTASIERVLCNGSTAGKLYLRHQKGIIGTEPVILPSTSPANAAWSLTRLCEAWKPHLL